MTKIVINGSKGKMGKALSICASSYRDIAIISYIDVDNDIGTVIDYCDVVVDFTVHTATEKLIEICVAHNKAVVVGTTGHTESELVSITSRASREIPIVKAANFSTGVNTLFWLTRKAVEILGPEFDLEIVEAHHRLKKDAPSGTAKTLAEILGEVRGQQFAEKSYPRQRVTNAYIRSGRQGDMGERDCNEIGIHSIRGGDVVGDHTVIFAGIGERVELTHKASSRETFAQGALRAAQWVVGKQPGIYDMMDVLGLT